MAPPGVVGGARGLQSLPPPGWFLAFALAEIGAELHTVLKIPRRLAERHRPRRCPRRATRGKRHGPRPAPGARPTADSWGSFALLVRDRSVRLAPGRPLGRSIRLRRCMHRGGSGVEGPGAFERCPKMPTPRGWASWASGHLRRESPREGRAPSWRGEPLRTSGRPAVGSPPARPGTAPGPRSADSRLIAWSGGLGRRRRKRSNEPSCRPAAPNPMKMTAQLHGCLCPSVFSEEAIGAPSELTPSRENGQRRNIPPVRPSTPHAPPSTHHAIGGIRVVPAIPGATNPRIDRKRHESQGGKEGSKRRNQPFCGIASSLPPGAAVS